jgi:hypothetical protein
MHTMEEKSSQFAAIWAAAKEQYKAATGEDLDDPSFPHPTSTDDMLGSLARQNDEFKHFREKRAVLYSVLKDTCKPIELVGHLAAGGAHLVFPPSTVCFGAAMYLINAAHGVSASYDAIADLLKTLKVSAILSPCSSWCAQQLTYLGYPRIILFDSRCTIGKISLLNCSRNSLRFLLFC